MMAYTAAHAPLGILIREALRAEGGNRARAAKRLGYKHPQDLTRAIRALGIKGRAQRKAGPAAPGRQELHSREGRHTPPPRSPSGRRSITVKADGDHGAAPLGVEWRRHRLRPVKWLRGRG